MQIHSIHSKVSKEGEIPPERLRLQTPARLAVLANLSASRCSVPTRQAERRNRGPRIAIRNTRGGCAFSGQRRRGALGAHGGVSRGLFEGLIPWDCRHRQSRLSSATTTWELTSPTGRRLVAPR